MKNKTYNVTWDCKTKHTHDLKRKLYLLAHYCSKKKEHVLNIVVRQYDSNTNPKSVYNPDSLTVIISYITDYINLKQCKVTCPVLFQWSIYHI